MSALPGFLPIASGKLMRAVYPTPFTATFEKVTKCESMTLAMYLGVAISYEDLQSQIAASFGKSRLKAARVALRFEARDAAAVWLNGKSRSLLKAISAKPGAPRYGRFFFQSTFHFALA